MKTIMRLLPLLLLLVAVAPIQSSCTKDSGNDETLITEGNVRHVILWTISDELGPDEKKELVELAKSSMERFVKEIDGLIKADVIYEKRLSSSNCDFMFDMYFKDAGALEAFSVNPDHLAVVSELKPHMTGRTCLDIEL